MEERPWHRFYAPGIPREVEVPDVPIHAFLRESARRYPHRAAVVLAAPQFSTVLSYRALDRAADRFAHALTRLGIRRGDRVAVSLPNLPQYPIAAYGALRAGATLVQVNPLYRSDDLSFILRDSGARVLVTLTRLYPHVAEVRRETPLEHVVLTKVQDAFPPLWRILYTLTRERREGDAMPRGPGILAWRRLLGGRAVPPPGAAFAPDDVAVLQYTGGTTGRPRGAMLTHRSLGANTAQGTAWFVGLREGGECFLLVIPLFHAYGLLLFSVAVRVAATNLMVLMRLFDARQVAAQVPRWRPTVFGGVPAMYLAINQLKRVEQYDLKSIRLCLSGAAALPREVAERFERLTGGRLVEGYGLTEASPLVAANPLWEGGVNKPGSVGIPVPGTDVRIVDMAESARVLPPGEAGELTVRGPQLMRGYWQAPEETAGALRDGWLFTGDVGRMDEDGYIYIEDRKKDMINVGGMNVYPREIEEVLHRHPLVGDAAVVGVQHPVRGETIVAYVTLAAAAGDGAAAAAAGPGATAGSGAPPDPAAARNQIREFLRARLPAYKLPRRIEVVDAIPKTLIGKPLRRVLRDAARQEDGTRGT